jgi:chromosome segregation ATPase
MKTYLTIMKFRDEIARLKGELNATKLQLSWHHMKEAERTLKHIIEGYPQDTGEFTALRKCKEDIAPQLEALLAKAELSEIGRQEAEKEIKRLSAEIRYLREMSATGREGVLMADRDHWKERYEDMRAAYIKQMNRTEALKQRIQEIISAAKGAYRGEDY